MWVHMNCVLQLGDGGVISTNNSNVELQLLIWFCAIILGCSVKNTWLFPHQQRGEKTFVCHLYDMATRSLTYMFVRSWYGNVSALHSHTPAYTHQRAIYDLFPIKMHSLIDGGVRPKSRSAPDYWSNAQKAHSHTEQIVWVSRYIANVRMYDWYMNILCVLFSSTSNAYVHTHSSGPNIVPTSNVPNGK